MIQFVTICSKTFKTFMAFNFLHVNIRILFISVFNGVLHTVNENTVVFRVKRSLAIIRDIEVSVNNIYLN